MTNRAQRRAAKKSQAQIGPMIRPGSAKPHAPLANDFVHVFVDDQNLFYGIVNAEMGAGYRIDFGKLLMMAARNTSGVARGVGSAYIAGVIPDDDSFWQIAKDQGFVVHRGYLGSNNRSKQDDAYLITEMTSTIYEQKGPSTIVLVAGDADYVPPLTKASVKGWRNEVAFTNRGIATALAPVVHEFRTIRPIDIQYGVL